MNIVNKDEKKEEKYCIINTFISNLKTIPKSEISILFKFFLEKIIGFSLLEKICVCSSKQDNCQELYYKNDPILLKSKRTKLHSLLVFLNKIKGYETNFAQLILYLYKRVYLEKYTYDFSTLKEKQYFFKGLFFLLYKRFYENKYLNKYLNTENKLELYSPFIKLCSYIQQQKSINIGYDKYLKEEDIYSEPKWYHNTYIIDLITLTSQQVNKLYETEYPNSIDEYRPKFITEKTLNKYISENDIVKEITKQFCQEILSFIK